MAEAADFSMPDVFANDYLDRIMKKTEKSLNNTCILYHSYRGHLPWLSVLYNNYLIKKNNNSICGLNTIQFDQNCKKINTKLNDRCIQFKILR